MKRISIAFDPRWLSETSDIELRVDSPGNNAILRDEESIPVAGVVTAPVGAGVVHLIVRDPKLAGEIARVALGELSGGGIPSGNAPSMRRLDFSFEIPGTASGAVVSFAVGAVERIAFSVTTATVFKVQRGGAHLFLDNDTNRSVDQYMGRLLLDAENVAKWREYAGVVAGMDGGGAVARVLICPAKEEIFPDLYPHRRAPLTPIDQVVEALAGPQLVFPLEALRSERESTYSMVDTHWSDYGAKVGAVEFLRSAGLTHTTDALPDGFYPRKVYGDLGGKVDGGQIATFMSLSKDYRHAIPDFDNRIGNHGRVWTFTNADAEIGQTLVIFGDSFAVSLSAILASVFRRVVYCYTAAGLDPEIIGVERPGYILAQTNQRFVVSAPGTEVSVFRQAAQKIGALDRQKRLSMLELFGEECREMYYAARMREILA